MGLRLFMPSQDMHTQTSIRGGEFVEQKWHPAGDVVGGPGAACLSRDNLNHCGGLQWGVVIPKLQKLNPEVTLIRTWTKPPCKHPGTFFLSPSWWPGNFLGTLPLCTTWGRKVGSKGGEIGSKGQSRPQVLSLSFQQALGDTNHYHLFSSLCLFVCLFPFRNISGVLTKLNSVSHPD